MSYVLGVIVGLVWGFAAALVNNFIMRKAIAKNTNKAMMTCNTLRMAVDFIALAAVFLLRNVLPFSFVTTLVATAAAMSIATIVFTYRLMKQ